MLISNSGQRARRAAALLAGASDAQKAQALRSAAKALRDGEPDIIAANQRDMDNGAANGLSPAMLDRLKLDSARIQGFSGAVEAVAELAAPVGAVIDESCRPTGLVAKQVRVAPGGLGISYDTRPTESAK